MAKTYFSFLMACVALGQIKPMAATGFRVDRIPWMITEVNGFSWANCDAETLPGKIKTLTILPDPLLIPGEITVSTILNTSVALISPVTITVTAEKVVMGEWLKIPCIDNVGSCTYDNFCDILDILIQPGQQCPEPLHAYGLPCHCPFQAGIYYLPVTSFEIPSISIPSWFSNGNYRITVVVSHEKQEIGCAKITFSLAGSYVRWW
ncbi:ganglioside GM2 activator-like [Mixophyes fleayi]|uniref:ganglioside GM2 activator-like n=1 Tax=Mixophyes fleayi TaxID=3061075 RepID=UPI003F4DB9EA